MGKVYTKFVSVFASRLNDESTLVRDFLRDYAGFKPCFVANGVESPQRRRTRRTRQFCGVALFHSRSFSQENSLRVKFHNGTKPMLIPVLFNPRIVFSGRTFSRYVSPFFGEPLK